MEQFCCPSGVYAINDDVVHLISCAQRIFQHDLCVCALFFSQPIFALRKLLLLQPSTVYKSVPYYTLDVVTRRLAPVLSGGAVQNAKWKGKKNTSDI